MTWEGGLLGLLKLFLLLFGVCNALLYLLPMSSSSSLGLMADILKRKSPFFGNNIYYGYI